MSTIQTKYGSVSVGDTLVVTVMTLDGDGDGDGGAIRHCAGMCFTDQDLHAVLVTDFAVEQLAVLANVREATPAIFAVEPHRHYVTNLDGAALIAADPDLFVFTPRACGFDLPPPLRKVASLRDDSSRTVNALRKRFRDLLIYGHGHGD